MDKDRIKGSAEQAKGKVKEVAGKVGMSRPLLNSAGRALPVDDAMRLSGRPQVSV